MARAVEQHWTGELRALSSHGTVSGTHVPHRGPIEAAHPVPDMAALEAAAGASLATSRAHARRPRDLCLISGGGSALLPLPLDGLTLADKQAVNRALLPSGATIGEMNCVRRHLSAIKGGRFAAACHPARVVTLLISDVPGDAPIDVASGPTVADPTTCDDALRDPRALRRRRPVRSARRPGERRGETIKPGDPALGTPDVRTVATPLMALEAAAARARRRRSCRHNLGDAIEGEAREVGKDLAGIALRWLGNGLPVTAALRAPVRRRDHGHGAGSRARRAQRRVPAVLGREVG